MHLKTKQPKHHKSVVSKAKKVAKRAVSPTLKRSITSIPTPLLSKAPATQQKRGSSPAFTTNTISTPLNMMKNVQNTPYKLHTVTRRQFVAVPTIDEQGMPITPPKNLDIYKAGTDFFMGPDLLTERPEGVKEALRITRAFCNRPFEQNMYISLNLGLDPRKPNQMVRGMAPVPHGSGGRQVLAVFATGDKASEAREAGADIVGGEELIKEIAAGGKIEFTRCIATPDMMKHLSKVARILGPKGLMPNPKLGTVTVDVIAAIDSAKKGQIEFRCDKKGVVHAVIGKAGWSLEKLEENVNAFVRAIEQAKPSGAKGQYFKSAFIGCNNGFSQLMDIRQYPFKA